MTNPKMRVRSLIEVPEECHGCGKPLGTQRTVTVDTYGNPLRFNATCDCFQRWQEHNISGFLRRGTELVAL